MGEYGDLFSRLVAGELRADRARKKMTIDQVVLATGLSKSAVLNYLNGKRDIPTSALAEICLALGIDPHDVFQRAFSALDISEYALAASDADYDAEGEAGLEFP